MNQLLKRTKLIFLNFYTSSAWRLLIHVYVLAIIGGLGVTLFQQFGAQRVMIANVEQAQSQANNLAEIAKQYEELKNEDQVVKNASLSAQIKSIEATYTKGSKLFEDRADLVASGTKTKELDLALAKFLSLLGRKDYQNADKQIATTQSLIDKLVAELTPTKVVSTTGASSAVSTATPNNILPSDGYSRQLVTTERGNFVVSMVVATRPRIVVETAGESDCTDNCPTKPLAEHVAASGGFAGINGAYFCPPDYAQCQGKTNTFDTLAVNGRTKAVLNRANNVYSVVPLVAMYGNNIYFYDQTVQWGVDTSGTGALANHPMLVRDGNAVSHDEGAKGTKGFIGKKDDRIVIGHVYNASYADAAEVLATLDLDNALNLDGGGSTALWYEGAYKAGPGRSLPTAIVLLH